MDKNISLNDYQQAYRNIVKKEVKIGYIIHGVIYIIINAGLITINLLKSPHDKWFYWPLLGWGFGLTMNYIFIRLFLNNDLEKKEALAEKQARDGLKS